MYPIEFYNHWLGIGTLLLQIISVLMLALFLMRKYFPQLEGAYAHHRIAEELLRKWGLWIALVVAVFSVAMTLFYSEVLGIAPCSLCWLQRIFLYPQVILFAVALWKRDRSIADYSIALSIFGGIIALYQHYLQMGGTSVVPCPATADKAVDCGVRFLFEFNYITYPLMSATLFAFLIVLMLFVRARRDPSLLSYTPNDQVNK